LLKKKYKRFRETEMFLFLGFFSYILLVKNMRLVNRVRNFLVDQEYYIDIYNDMIHVFRYVDILKLQDEEIILQMENFQLDIKGNHFRVKRLENQEILISGFLESVVFLR